MRPILISSLLLLATITGCSEQFTTARRSREIGTGLYQERNYADAAGAFRNSIRQDPRDFMSHYLLGVCYDQMGLHQQAFAQYRTSLDVMATTLGGRGEDEFRLQVLDTFASSVARHDPREVELSDLERRAKENQRAEDWFLVAKTYRVKGDADKAIDAYRRAVYYDVENFSIRREYGLYLLDPLNQRQDAENQLRAAWRLNGNDQAVVAALHRLGATDVDMRPAPAPVYHSAGKAERTVQVPRD